MLAQLSDAGLEALLDVLVLCEHLGEWPTAVRCLLFLEAKMHVNGARTHALCTAPALLKARARGSRGG